MHCGQRQLSTRHPIDPQEAPADQRREGTVRIVRVIKPVVCLRRTIVLRLRLATGRTLRSLSVANRDFRCPSDFMASGLQFAFRWSSDPLASGCSGGGSGHQPTERTAKWGLKNRARRPAPRTPRIVSRPSSCVWFSLRKPAVAAAHFSVGLTPKSARNRRSLRSSYCY